MYERKHCQDGKEECGFLVGAKCKADPNNPFIVTDDFHRRLKIVGCQSWSKYLDWRNNGRQDKV